MTRLDDNAQSTSCGSHDLAARPDLTALCLMHADADPGYYTLTRTDPKFKDPWGPRGS
jgi:hypothetical protein